MEIVFMQHLVRAFWRSYDPACVPDLAEVLKLVPMKEFCAVIALMLLIWQSTSPI